MKPNGPLILAFDTSAARCAAALLSGGTLLETTCEDMARGQAERLIPLLEEMLLRHNVTWADLSAIAVGVGPGNFTGIRISVSAARGLALGLNIPAIGVNGFDARAFGQASDALITVPATRGQAYVIGPDGPHILTVEDLETHPMAGQRMPEPVPETLVANIAHVAATRLDDPHLPPAPMYARAPDAAPSRDTPPVLLD
jgi:tRNA threonylcarbamoyl adenosine modification protein YeaZ